MGERILVVDDEQDVCRLLTYTLERAGFDADSAATAAQALDLAERSRPAVVVLDVGLPDQSGLAICQTLRAHPQLSGIGILMLTALGTDEDRIGGLSAGADDYVVKPFNVDEVVLRVRALCRRIGERDLARSLGPGQLIRSGRLSIDPRTHEVRVDGEPVDLRPLEYKLLVTLMSDPGRVFDREELLRTVWEMERGGNPRTVDVHIRRLRQNLAAGADEIETVPGFGYRARQSLE